MLELLERGEEGGAFETAGFRNGYDRILTVFLARHTAFELLHAVEIDVVEEILPQMLVEHLRQFGRRTVYPCCCKYSVGVQCSNFLNVAKKVERLKPQVSEMATTVY